MMSASISFPRDALEQAQFIANGWNELQGGLVVPSLSLEDFQKQVAEVQRCIKLAEEFKIKRSAAIAERNRALKKMWDYTKRIRNATKATFGDDSQEVEKMGVVPVTSRRRKNSL